MREVRVWSARIRLAHALLAASVIGCVLLYQGGAWHERLGWAALVLATGRIVVGCVSRDAHLRFDRFVHGPRATLAYARAARARREPRHLGHNPLGGWMIVALLGTAALASGSGALYTTDRFWGVAWLYAIHQAAGWSFALLVPVHVAGAIVTSVLQHENLVASMVHGRKRAPEPGDVP